MALAARLLRLLCQPSIRLSAGGTCVLALRFHLWGFGPDFGSFASRSQYTARLLGGYCQGGPPRAGACREAAGEVQGA